MVEGTDSQTLDGINLKWFRDTSGSLLFESWNPKPSRRVYIPKANGKMRPLGISSPRDKIVQQAMKLILEVILEPKFSDFSHGFRPKRDCHSALCEIRKWKGVSWFVEGDIKSFFDNIDHHILENLLKDHFDDQRFFNLYWKFVKAGYIEWDCSKVKYVNTELGVPQGGVISPILSNLMLHNLDKYVEDLIRRMDKKNLGLKPYLANPKYNSLTMRLNRLNKKVIKLRISGLDYSKAKTECSRLIKERRKYKSLIPNPKYTKITYVRYADDWIIGVWGKKSDAQNLKDKVACFLKKLKLELSIEKTLITNARSDRAKFLGTFIKRIASDKGTQYANKGSKNRRVATGNLWMSAPILELVKKLEEKGFVKCQGFRWNPKDIWKFAALPVRDLILRYNSIVNGITNYYSFVDNRKRLNKIVWIIQESLKKTLRRKFRISKKILLRKFGKNISVKVYNKDRNEVKNVKFNIPDLNRRPMNFMNNLVFDDPFEALYRKISTINPFNLACSNCGSSSRIQMHHIKHVKTVNIKLNSFDKMMARINRKQVPLCHSCHLEVHKGNYQGKSLKNFNKIYKPI